MNWSDIAAAAATLFFVMDPLGNIPVFNAVLSRFEPRRRAAITARELVFALVILLVLLFAGTAILNFLGLTQPSLNIAAVAEHRGRRAVVHHRAADDLPAPRGRAGGTR